MISGSGLQWIRSHHLFLGFTFPVKRERERVKLSVYKVRDFDFSSGFDFLKCQVNQKKKNHFQFYFFFFLVELIHTITELPIQQLIFNSEFDVIMNDYEGQNGKRGRACVVVLGDLGRSPRMQYHALSLARQVHLSFFFSFFLFYFYFYNLSLANLSVYYKICSLWEVREERKWHCNSTRVDDWLLLFAASALILFLRLWVPWT